MHLATRLDRYAPCCMRLWRWLVLLLVHVSIGATYSHAHANGLGFFVGKGEIFQVLALPYVLRPTPVEDLYGAQSVHNILDFQSGAIYACVHPHQRYDALPLLFGYVHASTPLRQFPNHLRRQRRHVDSCGPDVVGRGALLPSPAPPRPSEAILAPLRVPPAAAGSSPWRQTTNGRSRVPFPSTRRAHSVGPATRRRLAFPISALDRKARPTGSHICVASKRIVETSSEVSRPVPV